MIALTGHGALAEAYAKVNRACYIHSFRSLADNEIADIISRTDILIHNAATLINKDAEQNLALTKRIVYLILKHKPEVKFLYVGSMSYLSETGYLSEQWMTPYTYSKFLSEKYCFATLNNIKTIRFSTLFYRDPERDGLSRLIADAVKTKKISLINGGTQTRDWLPINIAAKELHRVATTNTPPINTIASGVETSFLKLANIVHKYTDCSIDYKREIIINPSLVCSKFAKTVEVDLDKEIKEYIKQLKID